jgi:hypothetical protein
LTTVTLGDELEEIGAYAFCCYIWLVRIIIPSAVKRIHHWAFSGCSNLMSVKFCDEIEKFVYYKTMSDWWNQCLHEKSLSTAFWSDGAFQRILWLGNNPSVSAEGMNAYFYTIDVNENSLSESPTFILFRVTPDKKQSLAIRHTSIKMKVPRVSSRRYLFDSLCFWVINIIFPGERYMVSVLCSNFIRT